MSKNTINLNSIINTYCENRYDTLENRIKSACKRSLFAFDYFESEEAKEIFELLFCTTYIERNIFSPSVKLFQLRLKSELQSIAPVFNRNWEILNSELSALADTTITENEGKNISDSSGVGSSKGMNIDSRYPQDVLTSEKILDIQHAEYGSRNESETSQNTQSKAEAQSRSVTTNSGKLDLMLKYKQIQSNLIQDVVDNLEHLFLMIY